MRYRVRMPRSAAASWLVLTASARPACCLWQLCCGVPSSLSLHVSHAVTACFSAWEFLLYILPHGSASS